MECVFVNAKAGNDMKATVDGIEYKFGPVNYSNNSGFAPIMIHDITHGETYLSEGYIDINGHIIESRWEYEYDSNYDNYRCNDNLHIKITSYNS